MINVYSKLSISVALLIAVVGLSGSASAQQDSTSVPRTHVVYPGTKQAEPSVTRGANSSSYALTWSDIRFEIGTRMLYVDLKKDKKGEPFDGSFIGSINRLEMQQDFFQLRPFIQLSIPVGPVEIGVGASMDKLEIATRDDGGGDGDVEMKGRLLYLLFSVPNQTRFLPYLEIGRANYDNSFQPLASWYQGGRRNFELDDSSSTYLGAGCTIQVYKNFSADLYIRKVDVDVDGMYVFKGDDRDPEPFTFTMDHIAYGVGVRYVF